MGLDSVEIVLRSEEFFHIEIGDAEAGQVRTVGDFYTLICAKLEVQPLSCPVTAETLPIISERGDKFLFWYARKPLPAPPDVLPWTPQSVWDCVVAIFVYQQGLRKEKVGYHSRISEDLGVD